MRTLLLLLILLLPSLAQVLPVGAVDGTVKDSTGGALPATPVSLTNTDTNQTTTSTTNEIGYYYFPLIPPGAYTVTTEKAGFKKSTQKILVQTGKRTTADFSLEIGQITRVRASHLTIRAAQNILSQHRPQRHPARRPGPAPAWPQSADAHQSHPRYHQ